MRTLAVAAITGLIALAVASVATAAPTVSMVWSSTTGTGSPLGGSSIDAVVGDVLELDIVVTPDPNGVSLASLSVDISVSGSVNTFYRAGVDGINDGVGNPSFFPAASATNTGGFLAFVSQEGCPAGALGNPFGAVCGDVITALGSPIPGAFVGEVSPGVWGSLTASWAAGVSTANAFTLARVVFDVVPEPATGGLLALGLGALAFIGRRRA